MDNSKRLLSAALAGIIAFIVTYIVLAILEAIFGGIDLQDVAAMIDKLQIPVSLLVGLLAAYGSYRGGNRI